jgi:hypothetical protein
MKIDIPATIADDNGTGNMPAVTACHPEIWNKWERGIRGLQLKTVATAPGAGNRCATFHKGFEYSIILILWHNIRRWLCGIFHNFRLKRLQGICEKGLAGDGCD